MIKKISNAFLACVFLCLFTIGIANAEPVYVPSDKSLNYLQIGWVIEPTWMEGYWLVHAYDPESPATHWEDYEE